MTSNIEIFLGNKLISCDVVVPFILSLKKIDNQINVNYNIFDYKSFLSIKQNEFLYFSLRKTGKLYFRGKLNKNNNLDTIIFRIKSFFFLLKIFIKLFMGKTKIFHFGVFGFGPFNLLRILFYKNIFLVESNCWVEHKNGKIVDNIVSTRGSAKKDRIIMLSKNIIYFNKYFLKNYNTNNINPILLENPRKFRTWYDHVVKYGVPKVQSQLESLNYDYYKGYFVYILGYIGKIDKMNYANSVEILIHKTLKLLHKYGNGIPVFIKPHIITDIILLNKILKKYNYANVHITYLHPAALAVNAKLVISNSYSITQADADFFGAQTVEYSDYSDVALEATKGQSENPNYIKYFINNDPEKFKKVIKNSLASKAKNKIKNIYEDDKESSVVTQFFKENL